MRPGSRDETSLLIQFLRGLRAWEQLGLAQAAGLGDSTISRYERGLLKPPPATLERLAAAAGLPMWVGDALLLPVFHIAPRLPAPPAPAGETGEALPSDALTARAMEEYLAGVAAVTRAALGFLEEAMDDEIASGSPPPTPTGDHRL